MNAIPDANDYVEVGAGAPEPTDDWCWCAVPCDCDDEPDSPQGGEWRLECEMERELER